MKNLLVIIFSGFIMVLALNCNQQAAADTTAEDIEAIKTINPTWFKSYNAGDADAIVALYADDAVLNPPEAPPARGKSAIQEYLTKDVAASKEAGITMYSDHSAMEVDVSGNLGCEWNTFIVKDKSGATIDNGKYVTVYGKKDGKWQIIRDIWNSDGTMQTEEMK